MAQQESEGEGTTGATSMTGGATDNPSNAQPHGSRSDEAPGGRRDGAAGDDLPHPGPGTVGGNPDGRSGGDRELGPTGNGSYGTGSFNDRGDLTGPDSPAGKDAARNEGNAQGDNLANRLGGGEGRGTGTSGGGSVTGNLSAGASERDEEEQAPAAGTGTDAGGPGGMGGARSSGTGRPPGGSSPVEADEDRQS